MKPDEIEKRLKNALIYGTSHPEAYMTKVDELWEKYSELILAEYGSKRMMSRLDFLAALKEHGELVKAEAVKVCEKVPKCGSWAMEGLDNHSKVTGWHEHQTVKDCATAISNMELP